MRTDTLSLKLLLDELDELPDTELLLRDMILVTFEMGVQANGRTMKLP